MGFSVPRFEYIEIFIYSVLAGACFGVLYDLFRIIRIFISGTGINDNQARFAVIEKKITQIIDKHSMKKNTKLKKAESKIYSFIIFLLDILYFLITAILLTAFLYYFNFGQLRGYIYFGILIGFFVYYNTFGRIVSKISGVVVSIIRLIFAVFIYLLLCPCFKRFFDIVNKPVNAHKIKHIMTSDDREVAKLFLIFENSFTGKNKKRGI